MKYLISALALTSAAALADVTIYFEDGSSVTTDKPVYVTDETLYVITPVAPIVAPEAPVESCGDFTFGGACVPVEPEPEPECDGLTFGGLPEGC